MRRIGLLLLMGILTHTINAKDQKAQAEEAQTLLNGNWVLDYGCNQDPNPTGTAWLVIHNNTVISCNQQSVTNKGTIVNTKNKGIYRFDWTKGPSSTAEYPVTRWNLLGLTTQGSTSCYSRVRSAEHNPPKFCSK
ncbi:hypothetical protein LEP1GSC047_0377 [Leptospira inadai serovar Lyme str. 10]|uniref:DUF2147 domain-containing protein n=2 Tax=Leptospira inadai serovar Lyme TaxID=293084 RepID=V6HHG9_9LEPT|nr:hypothetical protein [Leptospira inadai]EQA35845.1 hypothetical protein LEP1GSC047_0377 [Leptospira inadai serovar Lyme str. 10]PNV76869.1 hypothetical protein BES34_000880 [Leptospira inadai serovar Lyme]